MQILEEIFDTVSEMQNRYLSTAKFDVKKESLVLSTPEDIKLQPDVDSVVEALFVMGYSSMMETKDVVQNLKFLFTYLTEISKHVALIKIPTNECLKERGMAIQTRCMI